MSKNTQQNIQQFNLFTGIVFGILYDNFPNPTDLDCYRIAQGEEYDPRAWIEEPENQSGRDPQGMLIMAKSRASREPRVFVCMNTVRWLRQEKYIHYSLPGFPMPADPVFTQVSLGNEGLRAMNRVPTELDREYGVEDNFGSALAKFVKKPLNAAQQSIVGEIAKMALNMKI